MDGPYCWFKVGVQKPKIYVLNNFWIDLNDTILLKKEYDYFQYVILAYNFVFLGHS